MTDKATNEFQDSSAVAGDAAQANETTRDTQPAAPPSGQPIALEATKVPDLLARIVNRIADSDDDESGTLSSMKQRLEALKQEANAARIALETKEDTVQETAELPTTTDAQSADADAQAMIASIDEAEADASAEAASAQESAAAELDAEGPAPEANAEAPVPEAIDPSTSAAERGTFASVEAALTKLSKQADQSDGVVAGTPEAPWNTDAAEELAAHCEEVGLAESPLKDDLLIGNSGASAGEPPASYVYLQPSAQDISQKWFEDRFDLLAKHFEDVAQEKQNGEESKLDAGLAPLLEKFDALEARFSALLGYPSDDGEPASGGSLNDIELCIAEIAAQLEATTTELQRIERIESQISEIAKSIATGREEPAVNAGAMFDVAALADQVAERLAARPMAFAADGGGKAPGDAAGLGDLATVMKDFMRERRAEGEHANAVLDTMQQSIIRVLDRMEALEAGGPRGGNTMQHAPTQAAQSEKVAAPAAAEPNPAPQPAPASAPAAAAAAPQPAPTTTSDGADARSLDRLQRVVGQLEDSEPAPGAQQRPPAAAQPAQEKPTPSRIRADFIAAAREAAANAANAEAEADASGTIEAERAKFAAAARKAAAKASKRTLNDDDAFDDDATADDGFSIGSVGVRPQPAAKSNRARLLVAALAFLAVGLGATKFIMSRTSDAARETMQSNKVQQQGSSVAGDKMKAQTPATKISAVPKQTATGVPLSGVAQDPREANVLPGTVTYGAKPGTLVLPAAVGPNEGRGDMVASGDPGSVARKALPSALVGPLSLRLAAANGDPSAEFQVAARFADGHGVEQDFNEAIKWYKRSAGRGFALAQYRLGTLYERGLGVEKDAERARVWYERAAAKGNVKSMHNLAVLAAGTNKPDYETAARWFSQAAERGLGDSQFNLAILYQNGLGVPKDDGIAYKWFSLASASGDGEAGKRKKTMAETLGKKKAAEIDTELRGWMRKPADRMTNDPHYAGQAWQRSS